MTITSQLSVHGTTEIEAWRYPDMEAFRITFGCGNYYHGQTQVAVHVETAGLAEKLVKAINDCVAEHAKADALRKLLDESKGGNVPGVTEDHRYEMLQQLSKLEA